MLHRIASNLGLGHISHLKKAAPVRTRTLSERLRMDVSRRDSALQHLYNEARLHASTVKHGIPLPQETVDRLCTLLRAVPLTELGFQESSVQDPWNALPSIPRPNTRLAAASGINTGNVTYLHIYESDLLTLGVFCFPEGASIPLHDHPGLLFGTLQVRAYDWQQQEPLGVARRVALGSRRRAQLTLTQTLQAPDAAPLVLYPQEGGNIHEFVAQTPCAVLDLLIPPYCPSADWDCTYYHEPTKAQQPGDVVALQAIDQPPWFSVLHGVYQGLQVQAGPLQ